MVVIAPTVKLNDGNEIPVVGLGTFKLQGDEGKNIIKAAIDEGYRHFDTALLYHSEKALGEAIKEKIAEGKIKREDLFITSKLWCSYAHPELVTTACKKSLNNLGLDYVDLYLIHWPFAFKAVENPEKPVKDYQDAITLFSIEEYFPRDATGNLIMSDSDYVDTWKEMERCVHLGLAKSIGISNFNSQQIERLLQHATIKPAVNQVELHPYLNQKKLIDFCNKRDIKITAYSPLSAGNPGLTTQTSNLFREPIILRLAKKLKRTVAQIILKYLVQLGTIVIPRSSNRKRLAENIDIFDFSLTPEEMAEIDLLNRNQRSCIIPGTENHKHYAFNIEF